MTRIDAAPDFEARHLGPNASSLDAMLGTIGYDSVDKLVDDVVPAGIRMKGALSIPEALT
jgi:glycine dehydrogenase